MWLFIVFIRIGENMVSIDIAFFLLLLQCFISRRCMALELHLPDDWIFNLSDSSCHLWVNASFANRCILIVILFFSPIFNSSGFLPEPSTHHNLHYSIRELVHLHFGAFPSHLLSNSFIGIYMMRTVLEY